MSATTTAYPNPYELQVVIKNPSQKRARRVFEQIGTKTLGPAMAISQHKLSTCMGQSSNIRLAILREPNGRRWYRCSGS